MNLYKISIALLKFEFYFVQRKTEIVILLCTKKKEMCLYLQMKQECLLYYCKREMVTALLKFILKIVSLYFVDGNQEQLFSIFLKWEWKGFIISYDTFYKGNGKKPYFNWDIHFVQRNQNCGLYYKTITIVIYDHNDSGQYYNTRITIVIDYTSLSLCRQLRS